MADYLSLGLRFLKKIGAAVCKNDILEWHILKHSNFENELVIIENLNEGAEIILLDIYETGAFLRTIERQGVIEFKLFEDKLISYRKTNYDIFCTADDYNIEQLELVNRLSVLTNSLDIKIFFEIFTYYFEVKKWSLATDEILSESDKEIDSLKYITDSYWLI